MPSFYQQSADPTIFDFIDAVTAPYYVAAANSCGPGQYQNNKARRHRGHQRQQDQVIVPALDLYDRQNEVVLVIAVPHGAQKSDVSIDYDPATSEVVISGETHRPEGFDSEEAASTRRISEVDYGKFERRTNIAGDATTKFKIDEITAKLENGFLYVSVPKAEVEARKKIQVA